MIKGTLELYDANGIQYRPAHRNLKFAKTALGGEDLWLTFVLDRTTTLDWPDVAYGNDVIYRLGLTPIFVGEMRQIEQDLETITVKALGNWIHLDDNSYGGQGKLWCDTRWGKWKEMTIDILATFAPERHQMDTNNRLMIAPRKNERFGTPNFYQGAFYYKCAYDDIKRVTFNYDFVDPDDWVGRLMSFNGVWGAAAVEWSVNATGAGAADITLATERPIICFGIYDSSAEAAYVGETGTSCYLKITNLKIYGSADITPTSSDVALDIVAQIQAATPISDDTSLIETITLVLEPLFYERTESCQAALKDATSFGDENNKLLVWGVEPGGDRIYLRKPDRSKVRYVVPPFQATTLAATGQTDQKFLTAGWGQYTDYNNEMQFTAKYYAHVTPSGIVANTTSTGDDLASTVYGVKREAPVNFGRVSATLAVEFLKQHLIEHGHPQVRSSYQVYGPVQDLLKGGAWIDLPEMEMGYIVQIPHFRAVEAEGAAGVDLREWDTTFLLVGMTWDDETGKATLIPEGASEDLARLIQFSREFGIIQTEELLRKGG